MTRPKKKFSDWELVKKFKEQGIGHGYILRINCSWDNLVNLHGSKEKYPNQYKKMAKAVKEFAAMNSKFILNHLTGKEEMNPTLIGIILEIL